MFDLSSAIGEIVRRRAEWVDALLTALNPGETLCVHESGADYDPSGDRITVREYTHVLESGETCDMPGRQQQYGPAPADWRTVVESVARR